jgi:threonine dehydratase
MTLPSLAQIREAQAILYRSMPPTPQYSWPLINERLGAEVWIKHENHTPVGAFKIRGALIYLDWLRETEPELKGVVAATRGNHGQGVATAARMYGLSCVIVVPRGNSVEKNRAMRAQGAELVEHGADFQESLEFARELAEERGMAMVDSFHERLVMGTATYAMEFFEAAPALERVYVPIGLGSSICGVAAVRNVLGLSTEIVGVVASESPSYALSFAERRIVAAPARTASPTDWPAGCRMRSRWRSSGKTWRGLCGFQTARLKMPCGPFTRIRTTWRRVRRPRHWRGQSARGLRIKANALASC